MSSMLSSISRAAKAHHESANNAFVALYGDPARSVNSSSSPSALDRQVHANWSIGLAPKSKPTTTTTTTTTTVSKPKYSYSTSSSSSYTASIDSLAKPAPAVAARNVSVSSSTGSTRSSSAGKATWAKVKKAAREHHESVTGAYVAYYGIGSTPVASRRASAVVSSQ